MYEEETKPTEKPDKRKLIIRIVLSVFVVFVTIIAVYSTYKLHKLQDPSYQQKMIQDQTKKTVSVVEKLMELPKETPQIMVITDVEKLKASEPFFVAAEQNDKVLVYTTKAILYRPSNNKIINVGPVSRDENAPVAPVSAPPVIDSGKNTAQN